jgi:hypothetical protein
MKMICLSGFQTLLNMDSVGKIDPVAIINTAVFKSTETLKGDF